MRRATAWLRNHWRVLAVSAIALYVLGPIVTYDAGSPEVQYQKGPAGTPCPSSQPFCPAPLPTFARPAKPASASIFTTHPTLRLFKWTDGDPIEGFAVCSGPGWGCK
jgi:hypothetical protein